jgi:diacylglycerol O-acyltransferase / trehalose O-mycolyltransferase
MARSLTCSDGIVISGESDEELVANAEAHFREVHPELVGRLSVEEILSMAASPPRRPVAKSVLAFVLLAARIATAQVDPQFCNLIPPDQAPYGGNDPRVRVENFDGTTVLVLVPADYDQTTRSYPIVWIFHGGLTREDCLLDRTELIAFTGSQPPERAAIVAMPDGGGGSLWADWRGGGPKDESRFLNGIMPAIESRYRTLADRSHRAVAGISAGGFSALHLPARHPDVFAAAAGISGIVEMSETDVFTGAVYGPGAMLAAPLLGAPVGSHGPFGDPVTDVIWWRNANPVALASNFGGVAVHLFSGNDVPCEARDVIEESTELPPFTLGENMALQWATHLSTALSNAGVAHATTFPACGVHTSRYFGRYLELWWEPMFRAFGSPLPAVFDYRRADPEFSVWDWTFKADPARAPEFLDVADAGAQGLGISGSGLTSVKTAPYFASGQVVDLLVDGVLAERRTADCDGRITFEIDLGPAHGLQQFTPAARVLEAAGGYFKSRVVEFR